MDSPRPSDFYGEAFARNIGIFSEKEQQKLRSSRVAIAGMGGVGGIHLATLARMGVGKFSISDSDIFETANFNRQYGATLDTIGKKKAEVMRAIAASINPEIEFLQFNEDITEKNVDAFLDGADVAIDGIDFFAMDAKKLLITRAQAKGIAAITAGPLGFGCALLIFIPGGMGFDEYFGIDEQTPFEEKIAAFMVGLAPSGLHAPYLDMSFVDLKMGRGPSTAAACALCASLAATETANILLHRTPVQAVPHYFQFDPYRKIYKKGYLPFGGRNPLQRLKRKIVLRKIASLIARRQAPPHGR